MPNHTNQGFTFFFPKFGRSGIPGSFIDLGIGEERLLAFTLSATIALTLFAFRVLNLPTLMQTG
ncbi:hypothetical protein [Maribacter polysiphoniae]|uniref:hypothetical protein n=1 Tax=Maribacter polysiphoniae TaxID=429344 RepID=UPI000D6CE2FB|nr:hypothetical protein [Maribacter polysiphoniae]